MMKLNPNYADACASLLPSHPVAWWCAQTIGHMAVPVVRLDTILDMLPADYVLHYLKVDTEGNDVNVMKGAGKYMNKFRYVSAEVDNDPTQKTRVGSNSEQATVDFMKSKGFAGIKCVYKECHFAQHDDPKELAFATHLHDMGHADTECKSDPWYPNYAHAQKYWAFPDVK